MKKNSINFFGENIYYEKLDNGLEVYILPNNEFKDVYVTFTCKYGGTNFPFKLNNKFSTVPNGIAHFLEHKMFEQKSNIDPFVFFGKSGTYCNASTNYYNTSYIFAGNSNFYNNLNYLLDFVQNPYFTDENVEKEKGIISEEIRMYQDIPDRLVYEKILYNLFNKYPVRYSIAGTIDDINSITRDDLYNCYNTFYQPFNMFIVITGKVDVEKTIACIKENQSKKKFEHNEIVCKQIKEDNSVYKEKEILNYNIETPFIAYGIKIPIKQFKNIDGKKRNMYLSTIFNILFDDTSTFYEEAKAQGIIDTPIEIESLTTKDHIVYILLCKSGKYEKLIDKIDKTLCNINVSDSDLERKKRVYISYILYILEDISESNKMIVNDIILHNKVYTDIYDVIGSMNIEELTDIIKKLDLSYKSIYIIKNENY